MPKLPSITPQKVIAILEKKGFILDRTKGSHHIYYNIVTRRRVVVPFHKKDLPIRQLADEILKQAGITKNEIRDLL